MWNLKDSLKSMTIAASVFAFGLADAGLAGSNSTLERIEGPGSNLFDACDVLYSNINSQVIQGFHDLYTLPFTPSPGAEVLDDIHLDIEGSTTMCAFDIDVGTPFASPIVHVEVNFYANNAMDDPPGERLAGPYVVRAQTRPGLIRVETPGASIQQHMWVGIKRLGVGQVGWGTVTGPASGGSSHDIFYHRPAGTFANHGDRNADGRLAIYTSATVSTPAPQIPAAFHLEGGMPNPFRESTTILFSLPDKRHVTLSIFDVHGRVVSTLVDAELEPGSHRPVWSGRNSEGAAVSPGVYFASVRAGQYRASKKLLLLE